MNDLHREKANSRRKGWAAAIGAGVIVCLLAGTMLGVVVGLFCPWVTDPYPPRTDIQSCWSAVIGVGIWLVAIGLGVWEAYCYRPRKG